MQPDAFTVLVDVPGYKGMRKVNLGLHANEALSAGTLKLAVGDVSSGTSTTPTVNVVNPQYNFVVHLR